MISFHSSFLVDGVVVVVVVGVVGVVGVVFFSFFWVGVCWFQDTTNL